MAEAPARERAFEAALAQVNLAGARLGYVLSAVLMPAGFLLDLVAVPERALTFLAIRACASVVALALLAGSYLPEAERHPVLLGAGPPLICATGIELMIVRLNGVVSPYYAGLNLCILAVAVLYTWRWQQALLVSGAILAIWLLPDLPALVRGQAPFAPFFSNLYFLSLTSVIAVSSAVIRYRAAKREHDAHWNLEKTSAELAATLSRLQELDRLKNEFFANISHELRTPLTLILTPVEDLLTRQFPDAVREVLLVIRRNAQRLLRLIDDLLDLARLDVGGLRLHVAELDWVELGRRVVEAARPVASARAMQLELVHSAPELLAHGDPHRLEMVLTNLVGNALKFTPDGGRITVRVGTTEEQVSIEVEDTGAGIPESEFERIFERFYQVEGSERRRHGGAGIGLALVKKLVELHGGNIRVSSQVGAGSRFFVTLPRGRQHFSEEVVERRRVRVDQHPRRRAEDRAPAEVLVPRAEKPVVVEVEEAPLRMDRGRRPRVLIAEDESDLREYIHTALRPHFDVVSAADGAKALEILESTVVDLVLTDLMMPGTSGTDLCRAIKQCARLRNVPVIVLTALSSTDNVLDAYSAGADDFVTKPFHSRVLVARINAQLKLRAVGLQLADQARLATAGMLAGGVAHEVKNPLNAVLNAARLLPGVKARPELEQKLFDVIIDGSHRIEDIIASLEEHVRPADGSAALPCNLESGLQSSLKLLEHKMAAVRVHTDYANTRPVLALARELNQVFLNLLDNAVRSGAENVWVRTEDDGERTVDVTISDDGPGVPDAVAALIFEPFFTTRPVGEGTGLGLYISRRIVEGCGGALRYLPREGGGSVFRVEIPSVEARA